MTETTSEIALTPVQKAVWVELQIRQATLGNVDSVACPYCGSTVVWGIQELCCGPMSDATTIFLSGMEAKGLHAKDAQEVATATMATPRDSANTIQ